MRATFIYIWRKNFVEPIRMVLGFSLRS